MTKPITITGGLLAISDKIKAAREGLAKEGQRLGSNLWNSMPAPLQQAGQGLIDWSTSNAQRARANIPPERVAAIDKALAAASFAPLGITAWHGSPHSFDKFDLSKIGTGEGAQAYGHGTYLAQSPDVAMEYQTRLGHLQGDQATIAGKPIMKEYDRATFNANTSTPEAAKPFYDKASMLESLMLHEPPNTILKYAEDNGYHPDALSWFKDKVLPNYKPAGQMYKTDIPEEAVNRFLDWDKPLSQQAPEVQAAVSRLGGVSITPQVLGAHDDALLAALGGADVAVPKMPYNPSGADIYAKVIGGGSDTAAARLHQAGIPGIRYLDGGSRGAGTGTSNYVAFDPAMIRILEKNGQPTGAQPWTPGEYQGSLEDSGGIVNKADGGNVEPTLAQMRLSLSKNSPNMMSGVGVNEALDMNPKGFVNPNQVKGIPPVGGVKLPNGMPIGGIDMNKQAPGQQMMPQVQPPPPPAGQQPGQAPPGQPQGAPPMGNMLSMTPQGQTMGAMQPQGMAKGGQLKEPHFPSNAQMSDELKAHKVPETRMIVPTVESGKVKGVVIPQHMWHGSKTAEGMEERNKARAEIYGPENRDPLTIPKVAAIHRDVLEKHFQKPIEEQMSHEDAALAKLREAKHIGKNANTLDQSEKLDTVKHEYDDKGRTYEGVAAKGVAGHAVYTSGHGENRKFHAINTCPGQTTGCSGGVDEKGVVDTTKGTCFAPNAEAQYPNAAVRRACHAQAKADPAMTADWILAHTGSLRKEATAKDRNNKVLLFRPNVVDESDSSSRYVIRGLNKQRKELGKPMIIANSYGKTDELHDPENGYHVTYSNVGPKVKKGQSIAENAARDKLRVRQTITATTPSGKDLTNDDGNQTPNKNSYMVTDVKRKSDLDKKMQKAIKHVKYWGTGRDINGLPEHEINEGPEGHYNGAGKPVTPEEAHYGHRVLGDKRFDYQKQHVLHSRLVRVGTNEDGSPHMIPTDSRFKDEEFLPKKRFMTKNGKVAGAILMTTPTESTSNVGHQTSFTHHVSPAHVERAKATKGEYEIDSPEEQIAAAGKEYVAPKAVKFMADGGLVHGGKHDEEHLAFPEQSYAAQSHHAHKRGEDDEMDIGSYTQADMRHPVMMHRDMDTIRHELLMRGAR